MHEKENTCSYLCHSDHSTVYLHVVEKLHQLFIRFEKTDHLEKSQYSQ
jgi:hypothetical protein